MSPESHRDFFAPRSLHRCGPSVLRYRTIPDAFARITEKKWIPQRSSGSDLMELLASQASLVVVVVLLALLTTRFARQGRAWISTRDQHVAVLHATFWTLGTFAWVALWASVVPIEYRSEHPLCFAGLLWPVVLSLLQILQSDVDAEMHMKNMSRTPLQWDSNAVIGFAFTIGAFFNDSKFRANKQLRAMLLAPAGLCMCFVLSMPFYSDESVQGIVVRMLHKWALNAAVGIIVSILAIRVGIDDPGALASSMPRTPRPRTMTSSR